MGEMFTRSRSAASAAFRASIRLIMPSCSPFSPMTRTSLSVICSLISSSLAMKNASFIILSNRSPTPEQSIKKCGQKPANSPILLTIPATGRQVRNGRFYLTKVIIPCPYPFVKGIFPLIPRKYPPAPAPESALRIWGRMRSAPRIPIRISGRSPAPSKQPPGIRSP